MAEVKLVASNKRARHDYFIDEVFEAGIVLTGTEVKSLRQGRASLIDGFVSVESGGQVLDEALDERTERPDLERGGEAVADAQLDRAPAR